MSARLRSGITSVIGLWLWATKTVWRGTSKHQSMPLMPFPWTPILYRNIRYDMDHLADLKEQIVYDQKDNKRATCVFRFSFHCFTAHKDFGLQQDEREDRPKVTDPDSNESDRVFCPERWSASHVLPRIFKSFGGKRIIDMQKDYTFAYAQKLSPTYSAKYCVYMKIGLFDPKNSTVIVNINSAYMNGTNPPHLGNPRSFSEYIKDAALSGRRPGQA